MSKRKQEAVNTDMGSKKSLTPPLAVAGRSNQEIGGQLGVSRNTDLRCQNRDEYLIEQLAEAKANSRRTQLTALSKVVNKAFTGWTIKTQR